LTEIRARHSRSPEVTELFAQARFQTSIQAFEILTPPNPDYVELINTLEVPTLLVVGDASPVLSIEMATKLAGFNQHLKVIQIAKTGHAVPYDQPERFSEVVQTFLRSVHT